MQRTTSKSSTSPFKGHLLVVDDDDNNRDLLSRRLGMEGHTVEEADGGREAIAKIRSRRYDLVLLDIMMPEVNGIEVLKQVRTDFAPGVLPIIMATARDDSQDVAGALRLGANDYVTKPLDMVVLLARIQTQLGLAWYQAESERLSQIRNEFIQIASHDIKSPLSHILGYGNLILETEQDLPEPNAEIVDFSERIIAAARTTQKLVEDFLDLQVLEDGHLQLTARDEDVNALIARVISNHQRAAESKRLSLESQLATNVPPVPMDTQRIEQVVNNLVGNAIKYCPEARTIMVRSSSSGSEAIVEVSDTGPGLSEEEMKVAFNKYSRLTPKPTGNESSSGLGLAISKMMVEAHGGRIGVRANNGGGACFWFALPLHRP